MPAAGDPEELVVSIDADTITASGVLTATTVDLLLGALHYLAARGTTTVVIDLSRVGGYDVPATRRLRAAQRAALRGGRTVHVTGCSAPSPPWTVL